ncbi:Trk system potassium transporter TrkA [Halovulum sp. GXIMD14793]
MKVIICGGGQVGGQLARHLATEGNDVTVIDRNTELIRRLTDTLDVSGITGFASHPDVLARAGADDADMIIAATQLDEVNMVTCQVAHSVFSVPSKVARLRARSYLEAIYSDLYRRDHMPIDVVISPEHEVAEATLQRLTAPAAFDTEKFLDGAAQLVGIAIDEDCPVIHTPLRQLTELFSTLKAIVVGIRREKRLFVPSSTDQIYAGDEIYVCAATDDVPRTMEIFGKTSAKVERIIIIGGGNVGLGVAQALEKSPDKPRVRLIEKDRNVAEAAADTLSRSIVLHGDGLDAELLKEAGLETAGAVLALTDDDKTNLLSCARAKSEGCGLVVALINDPSMSALMAPLNIDALVNPRATTVSSILRHIRHGRIQGVYSVGDAEAEILEAQVLGTSAISGKLMREVDWPEGALVGMILKKGKVILPSGDTRIEEGDRLTVFALSERVAEVESLFQVSIDFF